MENENWFVYILLCIDGTLYTGITNDIKKRMLAHDKGKGAKYTKGRGPFKLIYKDNLNTLSLAMKEEIRIKKLKKIQKLKLANK
jgi:putative endonuclease